MIDRATEAAATPRSRKDDVGASETGTVATTGELEAPTATVARDAIEAPAQALAVAPPEALAVAPPEALAVAPPEALAVAPPEALAVAPPEVLLGITGAASETKTSSPAIWTRWTLRKLAKLVAEEFGRAVSRETIRRLLHKTGHSWKKAKKILGRADPAKRAAFVGEIGKLLDRVLHDDNVVLAYIDEAHVHQDADMGFGWSTRGERLYVASSSPGLKAKVTFYGIYEYSESTVRIWPYERANGVLTIEVLERLRKEHGQRPIVLVWDGASYHRSAIVLTAAQRLQIQLVRLPPYSPDFMPVEALWHWLREEVTYNFCHDTPRELIERVERFVDTIGRDPCALADRLWVKDELDPDEEKVRFSR